MPCILYDFSPSKVKLTFPRSQAAALLRRIEILSYLISKSKITFQRIYARLSKPDFYYLGNFLGLFSQEGHGTKKGWLHNLDHLQKYHSLLNISFFFCFFPYNCQWWMRDGYLLSFELLHSLMVVAHFPLFLYSFPAFRRNNESNAATFGMCSLAVGTHTMAFFQLSWK